MIPWGGVLKMQAPPLVLISLLKKPAWILITVGGRPIIGIMFLREEPAIFREVLGRLSILLSLMNGILVAISSILMLPTATLL